MHCFKHGWSEVRPGPCPLQRACLTWQCMAGQSSQACACWPPLKRRSISPTSSIQHKTTHGTRGFVWDRRRHPSRTCKQHGVVHQLSRRPCLFVCPQAANKHCILHVFSQAPLQTNTCSLPCPWEMLKNPLCAGAVCQGTPFSESPVFGLSRNHSLLMSWKQGGCKWSMFSRPSGKYRLWMNEILHCLGWMKPCKQGALGCPQIPC